MFCLVGIYESLGMESSITRKIMSAHTQRCFLSENSIIFVIVLRFCSDCSFIVILTTKRADISCFIPPQLPPLPLHLFRSGIYEQAKANVLSKFKLLNLRFIIILLVGFFFLLSSFTTFLLSDHEIKYETMLTIKRIVKMKISLDQKSYLATMLKRD